MAEKFGRIKSAYRLERYFLIPRSKQSNVSQIYIMFSFLNALRVEDIELVTGDLVKK